MAVGWYDSYYKVEKFDKGESCRYDGKNMEWNASDGTVSEHEWLWDYGDLSRVSVIIGLVQEY